MLIECQWRDLGLLLPEAVLLLDSQPEGEELIFTLFVGSFVHRGTEDGSAVKKSFSLFFFIFFFFIITGSLVHSLDIIILRIQ